MLYDDVRYMYVLTSHRIPVLVDIGTPSPEPRTLELPTGQGDGEGGTTTPLLGVVTTESRKRSASWNDVTKTGVEEDPQDAGVWRGVAEQLQKLVILLLLFLSALLSWPSVFPTTF